MTESEIKSFSVQEISEKCNLTLTAIRLRCLRACKGKGYIRFNKLGWFSVAKSKGRYRLIKLSKGDGYSENDVRKQFIDFLDAFKDCVCPDCQKQVMKAHKNIKGNMES